MALEACLTLQEQVHALIFKLCTHRWVQDRQRQFPSAANLAKKEAEAIARRERGQLDEDAQQRRATLREVRADWLSLLVWLGHAQMCQFGDQCF